MTARRSPRFSSPGVLTGETRLLRGVAARDWDKALTGNMDKTLADLKVRLLAGGEKRDASKAVSFDVASTAKKYIRR